MNWDPSFVERSPMLVPLAPVAAALSKHRKWPPREALQELMAARDVRNRRGIPLRLVPPDSIASAFYEERVYRDGELEVREGDWHDLFNVLAWVVYPRAKAVLNERHMIALREEHKLEAATGAAKRGRVRDAATLFDESGAVVLSHDRQLLEDLRAFRWKRLFWARRDDVRCSMRFYIFGHAIFEKALSPYIGVTAHALLASVDAGFVNAPVEGQVAYVDGLLAARASGIEQLIVPTVLAPLPVLGVPGWWRANEEEAFYDDARYFRPGRAGGRER
jgi:DUF3025 family protein